MEEKSEGDGDKNLGLAIEGSSGEAPLGTAGPSDPPPREASLRLAGSGESSPKSYAQKVRDVSTIGDEITVEMEITDGVADIKIPEEVFVDAVPLWESFLVGYFMGDAPHIGTIHSTVNRIWGSPSNGAKIDVQFISKRTVLFRIDNAQMRARVLKRRYWYIGDVPLAVNEWNPETAQSPPDLTAMPLWVDFRGVPGYLYSQKGLSFLSRAAGKFVKLHPQTERCTRLDVARVLVEVNLQKPLVHKLSFKDRDGCDASVAIEYPWLPPYCNLCKRWGHVEKECDAKITIIQRTQESLGGKEQGLESREREAVTGKEIVLDLIKELENTNVVASVGLKEAVSKNAGDGNNTGDLGKTDDGNQWKTPDQRERSISPPGQKVTNEEKGNSVSSSNGFEVLQNIQEEGEIMDDEESEEDGGGEETNVVGKVDGGKSEKARELEPGTKLNGMGANRGRKQSRKPIALLMFHSKLKALKQPLRNLNKDVFGNLPARVTAAYDLLCCRQSEALSNPNAATFTAAAEAWESWYHLSGIEEQFFYQKSRVQWLKLGDRNNNFYFRTTQSRNSKNAIRRLVTANGVVM
ncbi:Uncharacterized protein Rs2_10934 [Raphanus sativus]|nr:Uncharacterized protein Rs2_10934 [Raphanus sativus]